MSLKCNIQFSRCSSHEEIESRLTKIKIKIILKFIGKKCQPFPFVACIIQYIWCYLHVRWELVEVDISVDLYVLVIVNVEILIRIHRHQHWPYVCLQQIQQTYNTQSCNGFCIFGKRVECICIYKSFCSVSNFYNAQPQKWCIYNNSFH